MKEARVHTFKRLFAFQERDGGERGRLLREQGDTARDDHKWASAARAYQDYLALVPGDDGIWTQLGHSLKELGEYKPASKAYATALRRNRDNADLLLHYGHTLKKMGDLPGAVERFARSLLLDGNIHAWRELRADDLAGALTPDATAALILAQERNLNLLRARFANLELLQANDIALLADGSLIFLSNDPWLVFKLPDTTGSHRVGELLLKLEAATEDPAAHIEYPMQRLYVDFGQGFSEARTLTFRRDGRTERTVLLPGVDQATRIRWDPNDRAGRYQSLGASYRALDDEAEVRALALREAGDRPLYREVAEESVASLFRDGLSSFESELVATNLLMPTVFDIGFDYQYWLKRYYTLTTNDYDRIGQMTDMMSYRPKFSFVMPVYNTPLLLLRDCVNSLRDQLYPDFEICIADDCSPDPTVWELLSDLAAEDDRIKLCRRSVNGHISAASNSALDMATGDFIVLVDHDDLIPKFALFVVAYYINKHPDAQIIFSDEDKISGEKLRYDPYFKGIFNKYLMYGHNMVSHLGIYRRSLVEQIGGFRLGLEGSQDYDLFLRAYERVGDEQVLHIPHVLYHWRAIAGSTAVSADQKGYAVGAARDAINGHFERTGLPFRSTFGFAAGLTAVIPARSYDTKISIIIPTHNGLEVLEPCITSVLKTCDRNVEILVVDNRSSDPATLEYIEQLRTQPQIRVISDPKPFNFSAINNRAVAVASGEILCFLNNDTEVRSPQWLSRARAWLAVPEIGMVGARLLYEDRTLQHFGIGLGMADHRVAAIPHSGLPEAAAGYFGKARLLAEYSAVTAACMFMRKQDFDIVGGFEEALEVAFNDVDLSLRVRERGLRILCDPDILLLHKESRTRGSDATGEQRARLDREAGWMRSRWAAELDADPYISPNHALDRADFALAYPPRVLLPWQL